MQASPGGAGLKEALTLLFTTFKKAELSKAGPQMLILCGRKSWEKMRKEGNYAIENMYKSRQNNEVQTQDSALNGNCILAMFCGLRKRGRMTQRQMETHRARRKRGEKKRQRCKGRVSSSQMEVPQS